MRAREESTRRLTHRRLRKVQELQQPKFLVEVSVFHPVVVERQLPFEFHAADSHPNPTIKLLKKLDACRKLRGEKVRRASNHLVQFLDHLGVQVVTPTRYLPNLRLEFLLGLRSHRS